MITKAKYLFLDNLKFLCNLNKKHKFTKYPYYMLVTWTAS